MVYQIKVQGHLGSQWADWFEGPAITLDEDGATVLTGPVVDQAALHGLLKKVRDLGLTLISVNPVKESEPPWKWPMSRRPTPADENESHTDDTDHTDG